MVGEDDVDPPTLFGMRTNAKSRHTNLLRQARDFVKNNAAREEFEEFMPTLEQEHANLVDIHERYVAAGQLNGTEQQAAAIYLENIKNLQTVCA